MLAISYYDDDSARSITRGGVQTTYGLDPAGRRTVVETSDGAAGAVNHYADTSDNPAWSVSGAGDEAKTTRYESTIGGDLSVTIVDGVVKLAILNPHSDVVTTVELDADEVTHGIAGWAQYDEYGNLANGSEPASTGANTYGWHGADERALDASGLILMGARLYNSATGLFTTRDPFEGGNTTAYAYPQDPISEQDITGLNKKKNKKDWTKEFKAWAKDAKDAKAGKGFYGLLNTACAVAFGWAGVACAAYELAKDGGSSDIRGAIATVVGAVLGGAAGKAVARSLLKAMRKADPSQFKKTKKNGKVNVPLEIRAAIKVASESVAAAVGKSATSIVKRGRKQPLK